MPNNCDLSLMCMELRLFWKQFN